MGGARTWENARSVEYWISHGPTSRMKLISLVGCSIYCTCVIMKPSRDHLKRVTPNSLRISLVYRNCRIEIFKDWNWESSDSVNYGIWRLLIVEDSPKYSYPELILEYSRTNSVRWLLIKVYVWAAVYIIYFKVPLKVSASFSSTLYSLHSDQTHSATSGITAHKTVNTL